MEEEDKHNTSVEEQGMDKGKALVASDTATVDDREKIQLVKNDYVKTIDIADQMPKKRGRRTIADQMPKKRGRRTTSHVPVALPSSTAALDGIMEALTALYSEHNTSVEEQGMDKGKALVASDTATVDDTEKIQLVKYSMPLWLGGGITSHVREARPSSTAALDGIMEALTGGSINSIGVYGSDSTETADLTEKVSRRAKRDKLFDVVVMATVSHKPNNSKIQDEIAETLGLKFDGEKKVTERAKRLRERLQMERKVLVILRDLCKGLDLDKVGIPSSGTGSSGCKLLLTSASEEVLLNQMPAQQIFKV